MKCAICHQGIHWDDNRGWVHDTGYIYEREIVNGELKSTHPANPDWLHKATPK